VVGRKLLQGVERDRHCRKTALPGDRDVERRLWPERKVLPRGLLSRYSRQQPTLAPPCTLAKNAFRSKIKCKTPQPVAAFVFNPALLLFS
jgi:hypothetical protein